MTFMPNVTAFLFNLIGQFFFLAFFSLPKETLLWS